MLGDASEFTPLDLLGALAVNAVTTNLACADASFRVGYAAKNADGTAKEIPAYADFRFLGGVLAAAVGQFGGPNVRRAGNDAAVGLLGSYVATETCRRHAIKRLNEAQGAGQPAGAIPAAESAPAPEGASNYAYGW